MVVGAGPVGLVVAERAAQRGWSVLLIEKRDHLAGNCYDSIHPSGVMIHNYGPHYFRTDDQEVFDYLSRFTQWIDGNYRVKSKVDGALYPFPINLDTLEQYFGMELDEESARMLLESERDRIEHPSNSEEFVLSRVGKRLYEAFYMGYTRKMWGRDASQLHPSVCGRIPVKFNRDPYYVEAKHRSVPKDGYTAMFTRMADHPLIRIALNTDYFSVRNGLKARIGTIYTGPIDRYFDRCYGPLEWRSLTFDFQEHHAEFVQECVQINYPGKEPYTRTVEIKHVTGQAHPVTVVCTEYPSAVGDPYYPVPDISNQRRYERYKALAEQETKDKGVHFAGRLAEYTYINMDQAVRRGLDLSQLLEKGHKSSR